MRQIMPKDTADRLPEVLLSLIKDLANCQNKLAALREKERFEDESATELIVGQVLQKIERPLDYLDGDIQILDDELDVEGASDWCGREARWYFIVICLHQITLDSIPRQL